jgi:hypothetical protein
MLETADREGVVYVGRIMVRTNFAKDQKPRRSSNGRSGLSSAQIQYSARYQIQLLGQIKELVSTEAHDHEPGPRCAFRGRVR